MTLSTPHLVLAGLAAQLSSPSLQTLGYVAGFCTTAAFLPQLVRVLRLRSAREISLPTFLLFTVGVFLWLVYGIHISSMPVIVSNALTLVLSGAILVLKLRYDRDTLREVKP